MAWDIKYLLSITKDTLTFLAGRAEKKREKAIDAHEALNKAFISTYDYLRNKNGEYVPNPKLAELWNEASAAVMKINQDLGNSLYYKSRFWLHPDIYMRLNREDEILSLNEIIDEMERMRNDL